MDLCPCSATDRRCDACVEMAFAQLGGIAEGRGIVWADSEWPRATDSQRAQPWPTSPEVTMKARGKLDSLRLRLSDFRLAAKLTDAVEKGAARRWEQLRAAC